MALSLMPSGEALTWPKRADYMRDNFDELGINMTFKEFIKEKGPFTNLDKFRQCVADHGVGFEELTSEQYYNWILEKDFNITKAQIKEFWDGYLPYELNIAIDLAQNLIDNA